MTDSEGKLLSTGETDVTPVVDQQKALDRLAGIVIHVNPPRPRPTKPEPARRNQASRKNRSAMSAIARHEEIHGFIAQAADDAGRNNERFCEFLQRDHVPVPPRFSARSWSEAWKKRENRADIRAFKSYHRRPRS
jgi:hypothetical protein